MYSGYPGLSSIELKYKANNQVRYVRTFICMRENSEASRSGVDEALCMCGLCLGVWIARRVLFVGEKCLGMEDDQGIYQGTRV
jgi:hypothetical protein